MQTPTTIILDQTALEQVTRLQELSRSNLKDH